MTIMLKKNGQLIIDPAPPLEGKDANLDNLAAFISDPQDGNAIVYNATKGIWEAREVSGGSGGGMVVTVTVSDSSMVMNRTWKEINDALPLMFVTVSIDSPAGRFQGFVTNSATGKVDVVLFVNGEPTVMAFTTDSEDGYPQREEQ